MALNIDAIPWTEGDPRGAEPIETWTLNGRTMPVFAKAYGEDGRVFCAIDHPDSGKRGVAVCKPRREV